jgi:hypothetical protein
VIGKVKGKGRCGHCFGGEWRSTAWPRPQGLRQGAARDLRRRPGGPARQLPPASRLGLEGSGRAILLQDKGQNACFEAFLEAARHEALLQIPFDEIMEVSRVSVGLAEGARAGECLLYKRLLRRFTFSNTAIF